MLKPNMFKGNLDVLRSGITLSQQNLGSILEIKLLSYFQRKFLSGIVTRIVIENYFEIQHLPNVWLYFNFQNMKISFLHVQFCNKFELDLIHAGEN